MVSEKQIDANKKNALLSKGPKDCNETRFNAVKYGMTGECVYTKEEDKMICAIYDDLAEYFKPTDILEKVLISRLAKLIWRSQRINQVEEAYFKNGLINKRNSEKNVITKIIKNNEEYDGELEANLTIEEIDKRFELINRYEISTENRILKLFMFLHHKKKFK